MGGKRLFFWVVLICLAGNAAYAEFRTHADVTVQYDDNYFREEDKEDTFVFIPKLSETYELDKYKGSVKTQGTITGYFFTSDSDINFISYVHDLKGKYSITDYTSMGLDGSFTWSDNPADAGIYGDNTNYETFIGAMLAPSIRSQLIGERLLGNLIASGEVRDYQDSSMDDWTKGYVDGELEGVLGFKTSLLLNYRYLMTNYSEAPDYDEHKIGVGARRQFGDKVAMKGLVGYLTRNYDRADPNVDVYNAAIDQRGGEGDSTGKFWWEIGVDGTLGLGEFTTLAVTLKNDFEDSVNYTGEYYQDLGGDVTFKHELTDKLQAFLSFFYFNRMYQNQDRTDDWVGGKGVMRYLVLDWLGCSAGYSHEERFSDLEGNDFSQNRVWLSGDMTF